MGFEGVLFWLMAFIWVDGEVVRVVWEIGGTTANVVIVMGMVRVGGGGTMHVRTGMSVRICRVISSIL